VEIFCPSCQSRVIVEGGHQGGDRLECLSCGVRMEIQAGSTMQVKLVASPSAEVKYELLGSISEIPVDASKVFRIRNRDIAIFRTDQNFYALKNQCPHQGVELSGGHVEDGHVRCSGHGFRFDLNSGKCDRDPLLRASTYDLKIEGDNLFIRL
jgi:nitrite reductase/ring-hydroxylating ferredoxin subunit